MAQRMVYVGPADEMLWVELEALAARRGLSRSVLVNEAIRRLLKTDREMIDRDT